MDVLFLFGRILAGAYYLMMAANHLLNSQQLTAYASSKNVPMARLAVLGTGLLLLIGGLSLITGFQPLIGIIALSIFFLGVTPMMHNFWAIQDPQMRMMEMTQFTKNMALFGSALMFLAIQTPWPLGLG